MRRSARRASAPVRWVPASTPARPAAAPSTTASASTGRTTCHLVAPRARSSADSSSRRLASSRAASTSPAPATSSNSSAAIVNSDRVSTMVVAMPARSCGRLEVTASPSGRSTVSCETAALVPALSASRFPRAMADACGNTIHEPWPTVSAPPNAAGFTTAGP